jgi:hypothetical protein
VIELVRAARDRLEPRVLRTREDFDGEPRLADPGVAAHQQARGPAAPDLIQLLEREGELLLASDEVRRLAQV